MKCLLNLPFLDKPQNVKPTLINQVIEYEYFWEKSYIFDMFDDHIIACYPYVIISSSYTRVFKYFRLFVHTWDLCIVMFYYVEPFIKVFF